MLPSTSFHRLAIKQLNVRNSWARQPCFDPAGGGRGAGMDLGEIDLSVLFSPAVKLQGQPGRSCQPISFPLPSAEGKEMLLFGKFQVVPCCPIHFCPTGGGRSCPSSSWGCKIVQNAPGHRHTLWEVSTRVTLHSWRLCSEKWGVTLMP